MISSFGLPHNPTIRVVCAIVRGIGNAPTNNLHEFIIAQSGLNNKLGHFVYFQCKIYKE